MVSNRRLVVQDCQEKQHNKFLAPNFPKEFWNAEQRVKSIIDTQNDIIFSSPRYIFQDPSFLVSICLFSGLWCVDVSICRSFFCRSFSLLHRCLQVFWLHRSTLNAVKAPPDVCHWENVKIPTKNTTGTNSPHWTCSLKKLGVKSLWWGWNNCTFLMNFELPQPRRSTQIYTSGDLI